MPHVGDVFVSVYDSDKRLLLLVAVRLEELGFKIWAHVGTASVLRSCGIGPKIVDKISGRVDSAPDDPVGISMP